MGFVEKIDLACYTFSIGNVTLIIAKKINDWLLLALLCLNFK